MQSQIPHKRNEDDEEDLDVEEALTKIQSATFESSDTHSDAGFSGNESDEDGLQVMRATFSGRSSGRSKYESESAIQEPDEVKACMQRLRKTILKFPRGGFNVITSARQRYFAIGGSGESSLCYWTNEQAIKSEEPLGSISISSIREVIHKTDEDRELRVKVLTGDSSLTLRFNTAQEAESWTADLKKFVQMTTASP